VILSGARCGMRIRGGWDGGDGGARWIGGILNSAARIRWKWVGGRQYELLLSRSERRGAEHRNAVRCVLAE